MASRPSTSPSDAAGEAAADTEEIEWQFDALDLRPVERWLAALPAARGADGLPTVTAAAMTARRNLDTYLDTEDWRLGRAGLVLRTRRRGRGEEATLKDNGEAGEGGLRRRLEITEELTTGGVGAMGDGGPVGSRVRAVAGRRPLAQLLEVRTRRRPYSLRVDGEQVAEVALDETAIDVGRGQRPVQLRRVEVEVRADWVDRLKPLVDELRTTCGLQPATLSKFEAGLLALGLSVPEPPDLGPTEVTPTSSLGEVAYAVLRRHLAVLLAREPGTRLGEDIEELHDMRVATRRLRAALDLFASVLPVRAEHARTELRWLAAELGAVRDLDVQLERMAEMTELAHGWGNAAGQGAAAGGDQDVAPLEHLRQLLVAQRAHARGALLESLDSTRHARLCSSLVTLVRPSSARRPPAARVAAAVTLPELVAGRHRATTKAAKRARRTGVAADYHRLRIRAKRLRYALEFTVGVYGAPAERFSRQLAKLQDNLGLMQDAEVATQRLVDLATTTAGLPVVTVFTMGGVAERYRLHADELLASMATRLKVLDAKEWRQLAATLQRRREVALASAQVTRLTPRPSGVSPTAARPGARSATPARAATPSAPPPTAVATEPAPESLAAAPSPAVTEANGPDAVPAGTTALDGPVADGSRAPSAADDGAPADLGPTPAAGGTFA